MPQSVPDAIRPHPLTCPIFIFIFGKVSFLECSSTNTTTSTTTSANTLGVLVLRVYHKLLHVLVERHKKPQPRKSNKVISD